MNVNCARRAAEAVGLAGFSKDLVPMARGQAVSSIGGGLWFTVWALYLTREVHLSLTSAGVAMSVAGLVGFLAAVPLGRLADRRGPRELFRLLLIADALAGLGFAFCSDVWQVMIVASAVAVCSQGSVGVSSALVTQLAADEDQINVLARIRACSHAGQAAGAALGAIVIGVDARAGYLAAIAFNAATYLIFALDISRVPSIPAPPSIRTGPRLGALRDIPFTTLAGICGVLCLCWGLMSSGLPLWIADDTHAPRALSAVIVFCSTVAIALFQTAFSRGHDTPPSAAKAARRAGISLAACCLLLALSAGPAALPAAALLLCAAATHILGELWFVAASKGFSVPLMDHRRPAEYQSVFAAGEALAISLAPALMTAIVIPNHILGWCGLGLAFALAGTTAKPAAHRATSSRRSAQATLTPQASDVPLSLDFLSTTEHPDEHASRPVSSRRTTEDVTGSAP